MKKPLGMCKSPHATATKQVAEKEKEMTEESLFQRDMSRAGQIDQTQRTGEWELGSIIACWVERKNSAHRPSTDVPGEKISANYFAERSGVSRPKVIRYLDAWNRAADDLGIERSEDVYPGYEFDWLDEEWCEAHPWGKYYTTVNKKPESAPEGDAPTQEEQHRAFRESITRDPEFAKAAADVLREHAPETQQVTPEQVREAVRTNPEVEEAAREESFNRMRDRIREQNFAADPTVPHPDDRAPETNPVAEKQDALRFIAEMKKAERTLRDALYLANQIEEPMDGNTAVSGIRDLADQIEITLSAGGFDAELANLIQGENDGSI